MIIKYLKIIIKEQDIHIRPEIDQKKHETSMYVISCSFCECS